MTRVPARVVLALCIGLIAASQSGNIVRIGNAPPIVIAAWRLTIASLLMGLLAGRNLLSVRNLSKSDLFWLLVAGIALAFHFFAWIAGVQNTTVANAAICFSVNPVITATAARLIYGEPMTRSLLLSIALGIVGVSMLGLGDLRPEVQYLKGDALAVLSSFLFTLYFLPGKRLRQILDIRSYVACVYGVAGLTGFTFVALLGLPFAGYDAKTWACFFAMAIVPTMIGHTGLNYAIKYLPASVISTLTLTEPAMAGVVAYFAWGEEPGPEAFVSYVLIGLSVAVLVWGHGVGN